VHHASQKARVRTFPMLIFPEAVQDFGHFLRAEDVQPCEVPLGLVHLADSARRHRGRPPQPQVGRHSGWESPSDSMPSQGGILDETMATGLLHGEPPKEKECDDVEKAQEEAEEEWEPDDSFVEWTLGDRRMRLHVTLYLWKACTFAHDAQSTKDSVCV
jgi:hypothetical protein